MDPTVSSSVDPTPKRRTIFLRTGFQLRFALLVAGSLAVLLLFTGFHAYFVVTRTLSPEAAAHLSPLLMASTLRVFAVGALYVGVVTLGAIFLSHRAVGPIGRLENDLRRMRESNGMGHLTTRTGDDLEPLINELNALIDKMRGQP